MIKTKEELKKCLTKEKKIYNTRKEKIVDIVTGDVHIYIYKFIVLLRKTEYYHNNMQKSSLHKFLYIFYRYRKNRLGMKLGIEIWDNTFDCGLKIYHAGNIVVNGMSRIGKNCRLYGDNCVGNDGKSLKSPIIGDNVKLGVGSKVIGDVELADNITVAAGAVVIHSFMEPGITVAGVPAKKVK